MTDLFKFILNFILNFILKLEFWTFLEEAFPSSLVIDFFKFLTDFRHIMFQSVRKLNLKFLKKRNLTNKMNTSLKFRRLFFAQFFFPLSLLMFIFGSILNVNNLRKEDWWHHSNKHANLIPNFSKIENTIYPYIIYLCVCVCLFVCVCLCMWFIIFIKKILSSEKSSTLYSLNIYIYIYIYIYIHNMYMYI